MKVINKKETKTQLLWRREDGIVVSIAKPTKNQTVEDARKNASDMISIIEHNKELWLIDIRAVQFISSKARKEYYRSEIQDNTKGLAFIVQSVVSRMIGNFSIAFLKRKYPIRLFESEEHAIKWLKSIK